MSRDERAALRLPTALAAGAGRPHDALVTATVEPAGGAALFGRDRDRPARVLLATDGRPEAVAARGAAVDLVRRLRGELHIVHVWGAVTGMDSDTERDARRLLFREQLDAVSEGARVEATHLLEGDPALAILGAAEDCDADLVVMGARRLDGLDRWMLGSVSDPVARHARCAVLVVHAPASHWPPRAVVVGPRTGEEERRVAAGVAALLGVEVAGPGRGATRPPTDGAHTLTVLTRASGHHLVADVLVARRLRSAPGPVLVVSEHAGPARGRRP